ncbi:MAG TPA: hypothetical protein VNJ01_11100 [Bacteriovoracaceae bacterium]|nr:hypothetical protein [Bacteriovoracaceae bacterium]
MYLLPLLLLLPLNAHSARGKNYGPFFSVNGGIAIDTGPDRGKVQGPALGASLGYRRNKWVLELGYSTYDLKAKTGQAADYFVEKAEVKATGFDLTVSRVLWRFFTVGVGASKVTTQEDISLTSVYGDPYVSAVSQGKKDYTSFKWQAGLVLPLYRWLDFWVLYQDKSFNSENYDFKIKQYSGQFLFYF